MTDDTNDSIELACSLTHAELRERRAMMRKLLLPYVVDYRLAGRELALEFSMLRALRSKIEQFVELERQCCGFLTFTISPSGEKLTLKIEGPEGVQSTLNAFAEAASGE
ncbi:MAG: hypothetical protein ACR2P1_09175 [Pseudomonadales bacterium]